MIFKFKNLSRALLVMGYTLMFSNNTEFRTQGPLRETLLRQK